MRPLTYSVLALSIAAPPAFAAGTATDAQAETFMASVLARYGEAKTYSHDAVQRVDIEFAEGDNPMMPDMPDMITEFRYGGPGAFALTGGEMLDVYIKGGSMTMYSSLVNKYSVSDTTSETPTLRDLPGMFGMYINQQHAIESIVLERPKSFAQTQLMIKSWDSLAEAARDGKPGHRIGCTIGGMMGMPALPGVFWVDAQTGLVGAYEIDMTEMLKQMGQPGMPTPTSANQIFEFKNVTINGPIDTDAFTFEPGEDDERVDTFPSMEEIVEEAYGMGMGGEGGGAGPELGSDAPAFSAETLNGEQLSLADLKGKVVLIDFWATWCGPCVQAMPTIQALHEKYGTDGLVVIGVSLDSPQAGGTLASFLKDNGVTFTQIHDKDGSIAQKFGVSPIPHSVIIGKDGTVQANHIGFMPGMDKQYAEEIEALLKGGSIVDG